MKTCTKCGETKELEAFYRQKTNCDGYRAACKLCHSVARAMYQSTNGDALRASRIHRYAANRAKEKAAMAAYCAANPEKVKAIRTAMQLAQREQLKPSYVAARMGMPASKVTPELLRLKREQLTLHRLAKELKQATTKELK